MSEKQLFDSYSHAQDLQNVSRKTKTSDCTKEERAPVTVQQSSVRVSQQKRNGSRAPGSSSFAKKNKTKIPQTTKVLSPLHWRIQLKLTLMKIRTTGPTKFDNVPGRQRRRTNPTSATSQRNNNKRARALTTRFAVSECQGIRGFWVESDCWEH